ncbi:4-hydroxythreonine-4-phosphate dehydrogenase PdxA [Tenacibaculum agarivorans]|uniref:4-hydroxythreonine-4-phosphate dehydrogenase PdxA n=1 Tax=Tenacibaculum agarivorans TaxID=1908389 RepID=UPI00094B9F52|nr:4-hydroxythreonine-4-phosphate dehydrogenase PdxA [Tenacibaculum agarivorans]
MEKSNKIIAGISIGDINGIGIEVILKTFEDKRMLDFCTPVIFGSNKVISFHKKALNVNTSIHGIQSLDKIVHGKVNLLNIWKEEVKVEIGKTTPLGGKYALKSLSQAVSALKENKIDLLLTAPINKENIQSEEFNFPGHTEFLEAELEGESLMILMNEGLRIGLITGHIPVSKISETITPELITQKVNIMHKSLKQDFNIGKPKIAILGLNPHCGDKGVMGKEDDEIIRPTVEEIKKTGKMVFGPYAADGFFGSKTYEQFDGILAMYHDQGLAPFKALSFGNGVNFTAGLDKIRTSPDHGTGFDIAGKNKANTDSFKEALFSSLQIFKNRNENIELESNRLKSK